MKLGFSKWYGTCPPIEDKPNWFALLSRPQEPGPAFILNEYRQAYCLNSPLLWDKSSETSFAHVVPECLLTPTFLSFMARLEDGPKQRLNAILLAILQAGIDAKIESIVWWKWRFWGRVHRGPALSKAFPTVLPAPLSAPSPLTLSALVEPAVVLGVGTLAAAVAFLVEVALRMRANGLLQAFLAIERIFFPALLPSSGSRPSGQPIWGRPFWADPSGDTLWARPNLGRRSWADAYLGRTLLGSDRSGQTLLADPLGRRRAGQTALGRRSGQTLWEDALGRRSGQTLWADALGLFSLVEPAVVLGVGRWMRSWPSSWRWRCACERTAASS
ncbi:Protein of unknown function [Gryllus bimaculatus]|nr:Protein of unknown function [Gryllus bimaculatus]